MTGPSTAERGRLTGPGAGREGGDQSEWRLWGPYLSGRQWGTVREDYSADGDAWSSFDFNSAHLRAYRWGEDGIAGLCDRYGFLNLAVAAWNGNDDRLKERWFGLTNGQGNHGEDVKEYWWHVDATPTHSYAQCLYRYPHKAFPYADLIAENGRRGKEDDEYELSDTGIVADDRFFDITVTHAKAAPDDICVLITVTNHGPDPAPIDLVPQLWFRNTWSWGRDDRRPLITNYAAEPGGASTPGMRVVHARHDFLGDYYLSAATAADPDNPSGPGIEPELLFCDNETNAQALWGDTEHTALHPKNAVDQAVVHGEMSLLATDSGTKVGLRWHFGQVRAGGSVQVRLRLRKDSPGGFHHIDDLVTTRLQEADAFYADVIPSGTTAEDAAIARRAFAGLLWCKQHYRFDIRQWLEGDPNQPAPPPERTRTDGRNVSWRTLSLADVISMPDEWEYPWFASWDLGFHCVAMAHIDPEFAKDQLLLMCREWAMHPNGQIPAYEWSFDDVNPPVHAWAAWRVYCLDGKRDTDFLIRIMSKLLLNFGWWVNRKDPDGSYLFEGGFLGLDNIGVFNRSAPLPPGDRLEQSDATSWMAFFDLGLLQIAWELSRHDLAWDGVATKFLEHFLSIAHAMESFGSGEVALWDDEDGFFYDSLVHPDGTAEQVRIRSLVGLLPMLAVAVRPDWVATELTDYNRRLDWLRRHRADEMEQLLQGDADRSILTLMTPDQLRRVVSRLLDEAEFLSPHGIRSLSAAYRDGVDVAVEGATWAMQYVPGASDSGLFGGNSNWRGPVWLCVNVLLVDALRQYAAGREATFEFPVGSGQQVPAQEIADELDQRLIGLFRAGPDGRRPSDPRDHGTGPLWQPHPTFSEYFHGDTGTGLGASHQTGWSALVAHLICAAAG